MRSARMIAMAALGLATWLVPTTVLAATLDPPFATRPHIEITTSDFVLITPEDEPRARSRALQIVRFRRMLESLLGVPLRSALPTTIFALDGASWLRFAQPRPGMAGYFTTQPFAADLLFDVSVHLALLRGSTWIPFEQLLEVQRRDTHFLDYPLARLFYAQSWATLYHALASGPTDRKLPAYLETRWEGTAEPATMTAAAERLVGHAAPAANAAISRSLLARDAPSTRVIRLPHDSAAVPISAHALGADEHATAA